MLAEALPAAQATTDIPPWLATMRALDGTIETPGAADNPKILAMATETGKRFASVPGFQAYTALYVHDSIPWCGLATGYALAMADIMPPFDKGNDTGSFFWARSFATDANFVEIKEPRPGAIVVLERSGGGHVSLYERTEGRNYILHGGNQGDAINERAFPISSVIKIVWPRNVPLPTVPPAARREIKLGDTGPDVEKLQFALGLPVDSDFGEVTDAGVRGFQSAAGLEVDGIVGAGTWAALDTLNARKLSGSSGLSDQQIGDITKIAENSPVAVFDWPGRGRAPVGYIAGVALCFALAQKQLALSSPAAVFAAQADTNKPDSDALSWLAPQFKAAGMDNSKPGIDTLRHLFVLLLGLGMRESSGRYCEGIDVSAGSSSQTSETCEAGAWQTSWNIRGASSYIPPLLERYWQNPNGFLTVFKRNITPTPGNLKTYGSGDGARYQWLAKYVPAFALAVTGLGLRTRRNHWGPINTRAVTLSHDADVMFSTVQNYMRQVPQPTPEPEPEPEPGEIAEVTITIKSKGKVRVVINNDADDGQIIAGSDVPH